MGVTVPLPIWVRCLRVQVQVDKKTPGGHLCHALHGSGWGCCHGGGPQVLLVILPSLSLLLLLLSLSLLLSCPCRQCHCPALIVILLLSLLLSSCSRCHHRPALVVVLLLSSFHLLSTPQAVACGHGVGAAGSLCPGEGGGGRIVSVMWQVYEGRGAYLVPSAIPSSIIISSCSCCHHCPALVIVLSSSSFHPLSTLRAVACEAGGRWCNVSCLLLLSCSRHCCCPALIVVVVVREGEPSSLSFRKRR